MPNKAWIGWGLVIAGTLAVAPLVLGRGSPKLSHARDAISAMSDVERKVLKRKYEQYRALTESQRDELRQLHQQLEQDRAKGPRYLEAMRLYCDWLKTIDAWQQDELAHISQPLEKIQRVTSIVKERTEADEPDNEPRPGGTSPLQRIRLNEQQLTKIFDTLISRVTLTEEEQQQIDQLHGLKRFGRQVRLLREKGGQNPEKTLRMLSEAELLQLADETGNADLKAFLARSGDLEIRKKRLPRVIFASCLALVLRESSQVTEEQMRQYLSTLPPEQQDQLLQLQAEQFKAILQRNVLLADPDISELRGPVDREVSAARKQFPNAPRGDGPPGEGRGPRSVLGRVFGGNRPPGPEGRESPDGPPPPGLGPEGEPAPPRP
jgi:hypothetical protein